MKSNRDWYLQGAHDGLPIAMGYLAVSFTLGIAARNVGLGAFPASLMSITNLTSAGQFAALGLITAGTSYVEMACTQLIDHGDFRRMEKVCARRENVAGKKEENVFKALGVTYFGRGDADTLAGCMNGPYDDIIIDFGEAAPAPRAEWLRCQVRMMVVSFSEWQLEDASGMMEQNGRSCRSWIYLAAFGSEWTRREVERQLGVPVFRIPFSADAFRIDRSLMRWFEGLL